MKNKKIIIIYITAIVLIIIGMLGLTYGFIHTKIVGNESSKKFTAISQVLRMEFSDGSESLTSNLDGYFLPGSTLTKTFTLKNNSTINLKYSIIIDDFINEFQRNDITYEIYQDTESSENLVSKGYLPKTKIAELTQVLNINKNESVTYILKIIYNQSEENQIIDSGAKIEGKINVQSEENNISSLLVYGNSIQNGVPNPTTPIEIESVGDKSVNMIDLKTIANQALPYTKISYGITGVYREDGTLTLSGTSTSTHDAVDFWLFDSKYMEPGTYTISGVPYDSENGGAYRLFGYYYENGVHISKYLNNTSTGAEGLTFTIGENQGISFSVRISRKFVNLKNIVAKPQLEKGSAKTEYVENGKYVIPIRVNSKNLFDQDGWYNFFANNNGTQLNKLSKSVMVDGHECMSWHPENGYDRTGETNKSIVFPFKGKENTRYTISFTCKKADREGYNTTGITIRYSDNTSTSLYCDKSLEWNTVIGTSTAGKTVVGLSMPYSWDGVVYFRKDSIKLYEGVYTANTIGDYIPYKNEKYTIVLDEPLRKVGNCDTCADYLDVFNKKLYRYTDRYDFTENNLVDYYSYRTTHNWTTAVVALGFKNKKIGYGTSLCNYFKRVDNANPFIAASATNGLYSDHSELPRVYIDLGTEPKLYNSSYPITNWENFNTAYCIAQLETPPAPEIIELNIPKIDKNSIISIDTEVQPSKIIVNK